MKNKKLFLILILLLPITLLVGFSTWVIVNDVLLSPQENKSSTFYIELNDQEVEFNGLEQLPKSDKLNLSDSNIKYKYRDVNDPAIDSSYIEGAPKDAGEYYIYFESVDNSIKSSDVKFTITRKKVLVNTVEITYQESYDGTNDYRKWGDFYDLIQPKISFTDIEGNALSSNISVSYTIGSEMTNGYAQCTYTDSNLSSNVVGSTYNIDLNFYGSNIGNLEFCNSIEYVNNNNSGFYVDSVGLIIKYKTALTTIDGVSNSYCTIEDAILLGTGNITLCGNSTGASTYVGTSFCNLIDNNPYIYNSNYEKIKYTVNNKTDYKLSINMNSRTLYVPYNSSTSVYDTKGTGGNVYSVLMIPDKVTLNALKCTINIGASIGYAQPMTTVIKDRGVILNDGVLNLGENEDTTNDNSSSMYVYGFIKISSINSNGIINSYENSTIQDSMTTYDWPGGSTITTLLGDSSAKFLPLNAWTFHNNACKTKIYASSVYKGYLHVNITVNLEGFFYIVTPSSHSNASESLFKSTGNTTDYILKQAVPAKIWNSTSSEYLQLYSITGSNQKAGQKDIIDVYGKYEDSNFKIKVEGYPMSTSTDKACALGYMDININEGSFLTLSKSDYLFLPGSTMKVDGSLTVGPNVDLIFEGTNNIEKAYTDSGNKSFAFGHTDKYYDKEKAKLIVNGSLTLNGNLGGFITAEKENVNLTFTSSSTLTASYMSLYAAYGSGSSGNVAYLISNLPAYGLINNSSTLAGFTKSSYISRVQSSIYYWEGTSNSSVTNFDGDYKPDGWVKTSGIPCVTAGTLINMADGTIKKVEEIKTGDQILVFNHLTGKFDTSIVMYNAHDKEDWKNVDIINLVFDNGQTVKMVTEHAFFNLTLNEYSVFTKENVESFIGDEFFVLEDLYSTNKSSSKLIDVYYTNEFTGVYSPVTANGLNCFTDGFLSIAGDFKGFYNIFEFDENQKYDEELMNQDIEKYGLFTYEDFKEYVPEILFDAYQGQYLKVSIGKGHTTLEEILQLIDKYINDEKLPDDFINMFPK